MGELIPPCGRSDSELGQTHHGRDRVDAALGVIGAMQERVKSKHQRGGHWEAASKSRHPRNEKSLHFVPFDSIEDHIASKIEASSPGSSSALAVVERGEED